MSETINTAQNIIGSARATGFAGDELVAVLSTTVARSRPSRGKSDSVPVGACSVSRKSGIGIVEKSEKRWNGNTDQWEIAMTVRPPADDAETLRCLHCVLRAWLARYEGASFGGPDDVRDLDAYDTRQAALRDVASRARAILAEQVTP